MAGLLSIYHQLPPRCQELALSAYGLLLRRLRYGPAFHRTLARLEAGQADPFLDQTQRLRDLLAAALEGTEHYRQAPGGQCLVISDIDPGNFTTFFPVLDKKTVKARPTAFHLKSRGTGGTITLSTSGTSGNPLTVIATRQAIRENFAHFNLFLRSIGVEECQRSATFAGRLVVPVTTTKPPYWRRNYAMKTLLCSSYHLSAETIPFYIQALEDWQPVYLDSYPSAIYEIACYINAHRIAHGIRLKAVVTSSETLGEHQRDAIERAFQCAVFDQYGCVEMAVMAHQQPDGRYFIPPQYGIAEVLDDDDNPVKPGESGHLVCTGLLNHAMPLIRYRIGDRVKTSREQLEGYPHILYLDAIEGRSDDLVIASSGARVGRLGPVFKGLQGIAETQIVQKTKNLLEVNLMVSSDYTNATETRIREGLKRHLGADMEIRFEYPAAIAREKNGKFKFVKSEL